MFNPDEWFQGEQVMAGAAVLDEKLPGWELLIDLNTIDLESPCECVLGQLFTDYYTAGIIAPEEFRTKNTALTWIDGKYADTCGVDSVWARDHGFSLEMGDPEDWEALSDTWRVFIKDRLDRGINLA